MQDRSPPTRRKPLATHGRTIHSGQTATWLASEQTSGKDSEPDPSWPSSFVALVPEADISIVHWPCERTQALAHPEARDREIARAEPLAEEPCPHDESSDTIQNPTTLQGFSLQQAGTAPAPSGPGCGECHFDTAVLRTGLRVCVRDNWICLAQPPRTDHFRLHALRDHILHHRIGTLL
jgi:hypothetical protein